MKRETVLVAEGAAGYLIGAAPGARYQRLKTQATRLGDNPKVQQASKRAKGLAMNRQVKQRLNEKTRKPACHPGEASSTPPSPVSDLFGASSSGGCGG